ncbi:MAG: phosphatidate cytidylyltransferase [Gemmobacter sp.]|jgi:phosphatidate cytidylyltransferase
MSGQWGDLGPRVASAAVMLAVGGAALWIGGWVFAALIVLAVVAMLWELWSMTLRQGRDGGIGLVYGLAILLAGAALIWLRGQPQGLTLTLWLLAVVIVSDIMGYFAGRLLGGPKFWPRISPKKTWSGTIAGWIGALVVGWAFSGTLGSFLILFSPIVAFAGQMGDIAESAIKRRAGAKDSSQLIPGHGGVLDRFDAVIFAALIVAGAGVLLPLPW